MIDNSTLSTILAKSQRLCSPQGDRMLDGLSGIQSFGSKQEPSGGDYGFDDPLLGDSFGYNGGDNLPNMPSMKYTPEQLERSNMPSAIKEVMREKIEVDPMDTIMSDIAKKVKKDGGSGKKQQVNEIQRPMVAPDPSWMKQMIMECLDEYFENMGGTLTRIGLSNGKIKIVDNKGDIYSAKLEKIGNIQDKKKKD